MRVDVTQALAVGHAADATERQQREVARLPIDAVAVEVDQRLPARLVLVAQPTARRAVRLLGNAQHAERQRHRLQDRRPALRLLREHRREPLLAPLMRRRRPAPEQARDRDRRVRLDQFVAGTEVALEPGQQFVDGLPRDPQMPGAGRVAAQQPESRDGRRPHLEALFLAILQDAPQEVVHLLLVRRVVAGPPTQPERIGRERARSFVDAPPDHPPPGLVVAEQRRELRQRTGAPGDPERQHRRLAHLLVVPRDPLRDHRVEIDPRRVHPDLAQRDQTRALHVALPFVVEQSVQCRHDPIAPIVVGQLEHVEPRLGATSADEEVVGPGDRCRLRRGALLEERVLVELPPRAPVDGVRGEVGGAGSGSGGRRG